MKILFQKSKIDVLVILRFWLGFMMIMHSYETFQGDNVHGFADYLSKKLHFPLPLLMAYLAKGSELIGGILLLTGFFTRIGAVLVIIPLAVAAFYAHGNNLLEHGELALNYLLIAIVVLINLPIKFGLDEILQKKSKPAA